MRISLNRRQRDETKPTLRERAAALKATAERVMRRPAPQAREDLSVSLALNVVRYFGNDALDPALDGDIALREQAYAVLKAASISAPDLGPTHERRFPPPGSEAAREGWRHACVEHSRLTVPMRDGYPKLLRPDGMSWTKHSLNGALEAGEITLIEFARLNPIASEREMRMDAVAHNLNIDVWFALAYPDEYPGPAFDRDSPPEGLVAPAAINPQEIASAHEGRTSPPDPIFAAIKTHRAAQHAFKRTVNPADKTWVATHGGDTSPEAMAVAQVAYSRADAAETTAWNNLFRVPPTTQAGLVALILHAREFVSEQDGDGLISIEDIFDVLARGVRALPGTSMKA